LKKFLRTGLAEKPALIERGFILALAKMF